MLEIQSLSKHYGDFVAVDAMSLTVAPGAVYGFLGPNGAGKSTCIRMLMGILIPSSGTAKIAGLDILDDRVEVKRKVGYLPDNPIFYDYLRGHEIITFVGEMHGLPKPKAKARADELISEWGLEEAGEDFAVNYSLGMKKKLGLACAMVHNPEVLILDEPINGLDPRTTRIVQEKLRTYASLGHTVFLSTHLLDMVEKICTEVCIIDRGRIQAKGTVESVRAQNLPGASLEDVFLKLTEDASQAEGV